MKELLLVIAGAYVGWYLALNEKEATIRTLTNAKDKAKIRPAYKVALLCSLAQHKQSISNPLIAQSSRRRDLSRRPLTPPYVRFRIRRFRLSISIQNFPGNSVQKFPVAQVLFTAFLRCLKRNESLPVSRMSQW